MTGEDVAARVHAYAWTDRKPGAGAHPRSARRAGKPRKSPQIRPHHRLERQGLDRRDARLRSHGGWIPHGLFTSPHLYRFNERFQVNGAPIPGAALDRLAERARRGGHASGASDRV